MLSEKRIKELIKYWMTVSEKDAKDMQSLYKSKRYSACLLFGHMVLEKILKALVVQNTKDQAPRIHNLRRLAELAGMEDRETLQFLSEVNDFNMDTRYPDERLEFYSKCTKSFVDGYYFKIISLYKKICQKMK